jgi:hypothetical protein
MSLFRVINNEALDNDNMAARIVKRRIMENNKDNIEKIEPQVQLDNIQRNILKRNFGIFERQLFRLIGYIESQKILNKQFDLTEVTDFISKIVLAYNNIIIFLNSLSFNKLFQGDKTNINNKFKEYISVLDLIKNGLIDSIDDELLAPLSQIVENINMQIYEPVGYNISELAETEPKRRQKQKERETKLKLDMRQRRKLDAINKAFESITNVTQIKKLEPKEAIRLARLITGRYIVTKGEAVPILVSAFDTFKKMKPEEEEEEEVPEEEEEEEEEEPEEEV